MDIATTLQARYPYLSETDIERVVDKAKLFYYSLAFPSDLTVDEESNPISGFRQEQWILSACEELIERLGFSSAIGYRENGMAWTFDNAQISQSLMGLIRPTIGVIHNEDDD